MASRFFRNTGSTSWNTASNWSATDGGASVGATPTNTDDVFFTALSGNCVVDAANRQALSLNFTGYTGTITMTNAIQPSGNVTLSSTMTIAGTGQLSFQASATFTSNGKTWPNALLFTSTNVTMTLADAMICGNITASSNVTWTGSAGFTATGYTFTSILGGTQTFKASTTYNIGSFTSITALGSNHNSIVSGTGGTKANLNITGNVNVGYTNFTDINASGRPIYTFKGVVTTCTNIFSLVDFIANPIESSF